MPRGKKRAREVATENVSFPTDSIGDAFHLVVVNSCSTNDDIRLPTAPAPALLSSIYAKDSLRVGEVESAACAVPGLSPWKAAYWLHRVAHVPLGRHTALPDSLRLRHSCVSRLHACVVYVRTPAMHKRFLKFFPPLQRYPEGSSLNAKVNESSNETEEVKEEVDVVIVDSVSASSATPPSPPTPSLFVSPYYLLVNYSENPVFVNRDRLRRGRSTRLEEGDIVSFLECAFDEDGGIFTEAEKGVEPVQAADDQDALIEPTLQLADASLWPWCPPTSQPEKRVFPLRVHRRLLAHRRLYDVPAVVQEYVTWWRSRVCNAKLENSQPVGLPWLVTGNHLVRAQSVVNCHDNCSTDIPCVVTATPTRPSTASNLVCYDSDGRSVTPSPLPRTKASGDGAFEPAEQRLFDSGALQDPVHAASLRQWLNDTEDLADVAEDALSPLAARLTLNRAWLRRVVRRTCGSTSARVSLHCSPAKAERGEEEKSALVGLSSTPVRAAKPEEKCSGVKEEGDAEGNTNIRVVGSHSAYKQLRCGQTATEDDVAERFRVSLSPSHGAAPPHAAKTPPREPSVVQAVLSELRRSRGDEGSGVTSTVTVTATGSTPQPPPPGSVDEDGNKGNNGDAPADSAPRLLPVRRSLRLDEDPIELFEQDMPQETTEGRHSHYHRNQCGERGGSTSNASLPAPPSRPSDVLCEGAREVACVPGVQLEPAVLPVYVFTRRSRSPDVYTRERTSLQLISSTTGVKGHTANVAATAQYVYYFDPEESQREMQEGRCPVGSDPASPIATTTAGQTLESHAAPLANSNNGSTDNVQFEWVDESGPKQADGKHKKRLGRPRKRRA